MAAIVTDQFRILNANNFVETVENSTNSYYVFLGLDNPTAVGFGRTTAWDTNTPNPVDNFNYMDWCGDTMMFGKKVTSANIRRLVRRINWTQGTRYEMYRSDYSITNLSPITRSARLYDANYYVMNKNYDVYICIENGSTGISTTGNASQDEPLFTDLEPSRAGESGDGYVWKYLFTVPPSDIIKFDSTEYISVPNDWSTSTETQIQAVRENGNSDLNNNQIKTVYVDRTGTGYSQNVVGKEVDIVGDGTGAKVVLDTNSSGQITKTTISAGGKNYTYGMVDLGPIGNSAVSAGNYAKLIPVIPPSKGHGYDLYKELGTDKILIYARFDDSTRDFPTDTKFAQIGIVKNPTTIGSGTTFTDNQYSSVNAVKLSTTSGTPVIGEKIQQTVSGGTAEGYVVSFNTDTKVLKYFNDRSLYFNPTTLDQTDYVGVSTEGKVLPFESSGNNIVAPASGFSGSVDTNFTGISTNPTGNKLISLGVQFTNGLANSEINRGSGEIIYLDNRPLITRNARQKEDVKIILEF